MASIPDIHVHVHVDAQEELVHRLRRRIDILTRVNAEKDAIIEAALALDLTQQVEIDGLRADLAAKNAEIESVVAAMGSFDLDPNFPPQPTSAGEPNNAQPQ